MAEYVFPSIKMRMIRSSTNGDFQRYIGKKSIKISGISETDAYHEEYKVKNRDSGAILWLRYSK